MVEDVVWATLALLAVTASLPFYLYGAWIVLDSRFVTWSILMRHLRVIGVGLLLTTVPVVGWMVPRILEQLGGYAALHAIVGIQAYALLAFAFTGIVPIFRAKRRHDLYRDPDPDVAIEAIHPSMGTWRTRLRIGVFGYLGFWMLAYVLGGIRYLIRYGIL